MTILDAKDWNRVQSALERMECIELERIYQPLNVRVVIDTSPTDGPWTVAMIVTVRAWFRGGVWHQHCESVKQAKEVLKEWNGWQSPRRSNHEK